MKKLEIVGYHRANLGRVESQTMRMSGNIPCVLYGGQFHPVNDMLLHADFMEIVEGKQVKVAVPVRLVGTAPGVQKGGKLVTRIRKLRVKGNAENIPDYIDIDVTTLDLGKSVRVRDITPSGYELLESGSNPVASIEIPRALRGTVGK